MNGKKVTLGMGQIQGEFLEEQLQLVTGKKRAMDIPPEEIPLTKALRASTSYGVSGSGSLCKCRGKCENNRCPCFMSKVKCSTKCHSGNDQCKNN